MNIFKLFLTATSIVLLSACTNESDTFFNVDNDIIPEHIPDKASRHETDAIYEYLKFENDSFYYDITKAEARKKGFSETILNWAQKDAKKLNKRVQENLKNNIETYFINLATNNDSTNCNESSKITRHSRSTKNKILKYKWGDTKGTLIFPDYLEEGIYVDHLFFNSFCLSNFEHFALSHGYPCEYDGVATYEVTIMVMPKFGPKLGKCFIFKKSNRDIKHVFIKFAGNESTCSYPQILRVIAYIDHINSNEDLYENDIYEGYDPNYLDIYYAYVDWEVSYLDLLEDSETIYETFD